ncbi:MAG TPA: sulfotransferase [Acetobacteraceae bacterium]|nr:sulfotransferase [Acetobacteraceae bacterium]
MTFDRVIMVLGAPRSGTSWLGKIFDSHPDVLYRHEPDLALWEQRLPFLIPERRVDDHVAIAAAYLARLARTPTLKSSGQLPIFAKSYYPPGGRSLRAGMIHTLRWIEAVSGSRRMRAFPVPDLVDPDRYPKLRIVIKSISARGRARVFLKAMPTARALLLLRHPCGQVASTLRGFQQGKFNSGVFVRDVLATPGASKYGLNERRLTAASEVERLAWHWATMNELAAEAVAAHPNGRMIRYEDLCRDPIGEARTLFAFCGLQPSQQTDSFIQASTSYSGTERYYSVFRNAVAAADRWRTELSEDDQRVVLGVVAQTSLGRLWQGTADDPAPGPVGVAATAGVND